METYRVAQRQCKGGGRNYRQTTTILGDFLCWEFGKKGGKTDLPIRQWGDLIKKRGSMAGNQAAKSDQLLFARSLKVKMPLAAWRDLRCQRQKVRTILEKEP